MSVLEISRVDRVDRTYDLATLFPDLEGPFTAADVALLAKGSKPAIDTTWAAVAVASGVATVKWAGPDADSTGAVAVPATCDAWMQVADGDETRAVKLGRITILGGGSGLVVTPVDRGVPAGGTTGQVLAKASNAAWDTEWVAQTGGGVVLGDVVVVHGADTAMARPVTTRAVVWFGFAEPINADGTKDMFVLMVPATGGGGGGGSTLGLVGSALVDTSTIAA